MYDNIKILIVDDNADDVNLIRELLKDITNVQFQFSHEELINKTLEHLDKEKFDCILLDLNLPDSLGIDTLRNVLNKCPETPIVVLTVINDEDIAIQSLHDGAQDYLVKGKINGEIIYRSLRYAIERQKVENDLRDSENKYKSIVDTILEGFWMIDTEGKTTYVNKRLTEMLGYTEEKLLGTPFFDFVYEPIQDDAKQFFERRKKGIKDRYDFRFVKKDGSIIWVIVSATPIFDKKGKFAGAIGLLTDITDRKLVEQSLEKSVKEWNITFNAITDTICIVDIDGKIMRCNNAANILFKKSCEEIVDKSCWEILTCPPDRLIDCPIIKMRKSKKRETLTVPIRDKWFRSLVDPIFDDTGNVTGGVHIISDITKYKLIQDALKESEEKWRSLTENSTEYIITTDLEGIIQSINRTLTIPKDKVIGTSMYQYITDRYKSDIRACLERVKITRKPDKFFIEYIHKIDNNIHKIDNNIHKIDNNIESVPTESTPIESVFESTVVPIIKVQKVTGFIISASDITEQRIAQNKLKDSEELYRTITEYSSDMIWALDRDGDFTFINKKAEQISGYKLQDLKGKNFSPLIIEKDIYRITDIFKTTLNGQPQQYEVTFINKYNRHVTLAVNTAPIYSKGQIIGTISSGRDITETVKYAKELKTMTERLAMSNKELEHFAYIASHDLQEPLRTISSYTQLLEDRYKSKLDPDAEEFISYIVNGTKRMQHMIEDLLALSRVGTRGKEFVPTDVTDILNDSLKNLHAMIERNNVTITIDKMPIINVDSSQLIQLFQNLIDNAIKFHREETPKIDISSKKQDDEWIFSIKDNGIGINKKDFKKLFQAFSRLHSRDKYPGTGIGLAVCKKIVDRHGGRIWVESEIGIGSTFYFTIPVRSKNLDDITT